MQPTLLILAAGMGSRYGGLKQIDPVGPSGEIIMDYSVFDAQQAGFGKVVFVIQRSFAQQFNQQIGEKYRKHIPVTSVFKDLDDLPAGFKLPASRVKPWGTAHAVRAAREVISEPFAIINADDFYGRPAFQIMAEKLKQTDPAHSDWSMAGYRISKTLSAHGGVSRGICQLKNGSLKSIEEFFNIKQVGEIIQAQDGADKIHTLDSATLCSMNFFGFTPTIFKILEGSFIKFLTTSGQEEKSEFLIPSVVNESINSGQAEMEVLDPNSSWFGMTFPEDKPMVMSNIQRLVNEKIYPSPLWI